MKRRTPTPPMPDLARPLRCAIYVRKSTDDGLDRDFTSLDAQREACEAYIASQRHEGWTALPTRYDDGGYSGATMERPAMQRLLAEIEAGGIDVLVCYKLDRVSRSLLDFLTLMEFLERHHVALISVTQSINTETSMGRLMLSVLAAFGAYERELIAERTRDKMSAARRKGKWTGGTPVLGYDVHPEGGKLLVNETEATIVRELFRLYLLHRSLRLVVEEARARGWTTKAWRTREGRWHAGTPLNKSHVHHLLTNVLYLGQVNHHSTVYPGEHPAIIDETTFAEVQRLLTSRGHAYERTLPTGLLKGLLTCAACGTAMIHTHTKKGDKRYRYYTCTTAQKRGVAHCPTRSVNADELEGIVLAQVRRLAQAPELVQAMIAPVQAEMATQRPVLQAEIRQARHALDRLTVSQPDGKPAQSEALEAATCRLNTLRAQLKALEATAITPEAISALLARFDPIWDALFPEERRRVLHLMLERVDYHGGTGTLGINFYPLGLQTLQDEVTASASETTQA